MDAVDKLRALKREIRALPKSQQQARFASPEFQALVVAAQAEAASATQAGFLCFGHCNSHCNAHCGSHCIEHLYATTGQASPVG
jgi:hypothetical protein